MHGAKQSSSTRQCATSQRSTTLRRTTLVLAMHVRCVALLLCAADVGHSTHNCGTRLPQPCCHTHSNCLTRGQNSADVARRERGCL
eukprot:398182-Prymnesium_polylepis.1